MSATEVFIENHIRTPQRIPTMSQVRKSLTLKLRSICVQPGGKKRVPLGAFLENREWLDPLVQKGLVRVFGLPEKYQTGTKKAPKKVMSPQEPEASIAEPASGKDDAASGAVSEAQPENPEIPVESGEGSDAPEAAPAEPPVAATIPNVDDGSKGSYPSPDQVLEMEYNSLRKLAKELGISTKGMKKATITEAVVDKLGG